MKLKWSDKIRNDYKIYLEPLLATACEHEGNKKGITRSKYIRYAVINQLIADGYPLENINPNKYGIFANTLKYSFKERARRILNYNVGLGNIVVPEFCEKCGVKPLVGSSKRRRLQAHHKDYFKPLDVVWLCASCHCNINKDNNLQIK